MNVISLALLLAALVPPAGAAPAGERAPRGGLVVETVGRCPARDAVLAALRPVFGDEALRATPGVSRVSDLGDRFEVVARGQSRQYADAARDCAERARVAAVFITLAVKPPMFAVRAEAGPPGLVEAREPGGSAASPVVWARFGAGARVDGGSGGGPTAVTSGVELHGALGRGSLGVVASAGILAPIESRLSSVVVRQQRFPCAVAVVGRRALGQLEGAASAGVALVPFTLRAQGLASPRPATRVDAGARLAFQLRLLRASWLSPFAEIHAEYFPRSYAVDVDPVGNVGATGRLWLGAALGVSFHARP
ncbi:MAG TPA: hypothetical protein VIF57_11890 [Polyangia bacterium]